MSGFLGDLIAKSQGVLAESAKVEGKETVAIQHDRYDHEDWVETRDNAPALQTALEDLAQTFDYTEDLAEGVFDYFLKADPEVVDAEQMKLSHKPNRQITIESSETPQATELRSYTKGDSYSAAMAVTGISEKLKEHLQHHKDLSDAAKKAQEEAQASQDANDALADAQAAAQGQQDEYSGDGPMTQAQADAAAALQAAIDAQAAAQAAAAAAGAQLDQSISNAGPAIRTAVRAGIADAAQEAGEQAAAMAGAGVDPGEVKHMSFGQRKQLAEAMDNSRLRAIAWLIGRFRMEARAEMARRVEGRREVFTTIELGRDLSRVLGSEIAKFAGPRPLKLQTMIRYSEGKLLQKRFEGSERQGRGPIISIVDTSGSMGAGIGGDMMDDEMARSIPTREAWAKAITFVLLDSARRQKRDFYCILFSSRDEQRHYCFPASGRAYIAAPNGKRIEVPSPIPSQPDLGVVTDLITFMFNGGTDFERPLTQAVDILENNYNEDGKGKADLVFITDDDGHVSEAFMERYQAIKAKVGFRTFGFAVGCGYGSTLEAVSDNVRSLKDISNTEEVKDVIRSV